MMSQDKLDYTNQDAGMATVETAIALVIISVFFAMLCAIIFLCMMKIKAIDISCEIARLAARGENFPQNDKNISINISHEKNLIIAEVTIDVPLMHQQVHSRSYALEENSFSEVK